jgi:hypothetical protein
VHFKINFCNQFSRLNIHLDTHNCHLANEPCDTQIEALFENLVAILIGNGYWGSVVGVETSSGLYGPELESRQGQNIFISHDRPDRLWGHHSLFYGYRGSFPEIKGAGE